MSQTIDMVARAIYEGRNGPGCTSWGLQRKAHRAPYIADAENAIKALRNMEFQARDDGGVIHELRGPVMDTWRFLLDAAVK